MSKLYRPVINIWINQTDYLKIAKEIVKKNYKDADCGIFNTRNIMGDEMRVLFSDDKLRVEICDTWSYFEVFGLTDEEFCELKDFYNSLEQV